MQKNLIDILSSKAKTLQSRLSKIQCIKLTFKDQINYSLESQLRLAAIIFFIFISVNAYSNNRAPIAVRTFSIISQSMAESYSLVGQVKVPDTITFTAQAPGNVDYILRAGESAVEQDQKIISIDEKSITQQRHLFELKYKIARTGYEKDLSLFNKKIISGDSLDKSKINFENAHNDLLTIQSKYNNMVIHAPFEGKISAINLSVGSNVKPGDLLFTLTPVNNRMREVFIDIPERFFNILHYNTEIYFSYLKQPKVKGQISLISSSLKDNGTFEVKAIIKNALGIPHNSYVDTEILFNPHEANVVPETAILRNEKGSYVFIVSQDNKAKQVYVSLGVRSDQFVEIISDEISVGDKVLVEGLTKVYDAAEILEIVN